MSRSETQTAGKTGRERNGKENTKLCKGDRGESHKQPAPDIEPAPSGRQTPPEAAPHFLSSAIPLCTAGRWPASLTITSSTHLAAIASVSAHSHLASYLAANTHHWRVGGLEVVVGISLPMCLGYLGLYAHDYSACTKTQAETQTPCQEA